MGRLLGAVGAAAVNGRDASGRRGEELERDAVGVSEAEARAVVGVDDAAVGDAEIVQSPFPAEEAVSVGAPKPMWSSPVRSSLNVSSGSVRGCSFRPSSVPWMRKTA